MKIIIKYFGSCCLLVFFFMNIANPVYAAPACGTGCTVNEDCSDISCPVCADTSTKSCNWIGSYTCAGGITTSWGSDGGCIATPPGCVTNQGCQLYCVSYPGPSVCTAGVRPTPTLTPTPICAITACSIDTVAANGDTIHAAMDPSKGTIVAEGGGDYRETLNDAPTSNLGTWTTTTSSTGKPQSGNIWEIQCSNTDPTKWSIGGMYYNGFVGRNYSWTHTSSGLSSTQTLSRTYNNIATNPGNDTTSNTCNPSTPIPTPTPTLAGPGNVANLNFTLSQPTNGWWQSVGLDVHFNGTYNNAADIAPAAPVGSNVCPYGIARSNTADPTTDGVFFTGQTTNPWAASGLGSGVKVSQEGYSVIGELDQSTSTTSFTVLHQSIVSNGESQFGINASTGSTLSNYKAIGSGQLSCASDTCTVSDNLANGVYYLDACPGTDPTTACATTINLKTSDVTGFNPATSKSYIFLVHGTLDIQNKIIIPKGSTALFTASGDLDVDASVGETTPAASCATTTPDLEGIFSADHNIIIKTSQTVTNTCPTTVDSQLNVQGSMISDASGNGGSFQMKRSLCDNNATSPAYTITARPDFILNAPEIEKVTNTSYSEIIP